MKLEKRLEQEIGGIKSGLIVSALRKAGVVLHDKVIEVLPYLITDAINKYDPERGASIETWVYSYIGYRIHRYLKNKIYTKSFDAANTFDKDDNNCNLYLNIASDYNLEETVIVKAEEGYITSVIDCLKEGKEKLAGERLLQAAKDGTINTFRAQLARDLGMSREGARKLVNRVKDKMKKTYLSR